MTSPTLDYRSPPGPTPRSTALRQRLLYCLGLPLVGFGIGAGAYRGSDAIVLGLITAIGAFLVALALPTSRSN